MAPAKGPVGYGPGDTVSKQSTEGAAARPAPAERARAGGEVSLAGQVVLVTGASSGIGRAIALACAGSGADVALTYHGNQAGAEGTADAVRGLGRRAEVLRADVAEPADVTALARGAQAAFGRVDVWINNAGADILTGAATRLSWAEKLDRVLAVDLRGTVLASWAAVELMRRQETGGTILNMAWDHVLGGGTKGEYAEIFCAAKGGVYSFSRALARTVAPHIRVNVLGPGWVETAYGAELDPAVKARITDAIPLKRWAHPEEIAAAAVFLASDAASYITGQMLVINGGAVT
ncbi:MAG: 3-oxoacyl-ACP reductase [Gemmatimonadetes bacterium]|nr:MAG: 3-oxoacyl-ACP reductase [Gemmatimonadota bacterium]